MARVNIALSCTKWSQAFLLTILFSSSLVTGFIINDLVLEQDILAKYGSIFLTNTSIPEFVINHCCCSSQTQMRAYETMTSVRDGKSVDIVQLMGRKQRFYYETCDQVNEPCTLGCKCKQTNLIFTALVIRNATVVSLESVEAPSLCRCINNAATDQSRTINSTVLQPATAGPDGQCSRNTAQRTTTPRNITVIFYFLLLSTVLRYL